MTTAEAQKPGLQSFLEEVRCMLWDALDHAHPTHLQMLLAAYQQGKTPKEAAAVIDNQQAKLSVVDPDRFLADAKDALRNHALSVEQRVQALSNQISGSVQANGPVDGLLYFSHAAHELPRLGAQLTVYREFLSLLHIVQESLDSVKVTLDMVREEAVSRLVNMGEEDGSSERAGANEALKKVIKIVDYAL